MGLAVDLLEAGQDWNDRNNAVRRVARQSQRSARDLPSDYASRNPGYRRTRQCGPEWSPAVSGFVYEKRLGRTEFVPATITGRDELGRPVLTMLSRGSSASLMAMALADGIAMLPPDVGSIGRGIPLRLESFRCG
jgi:hypothetical protein